jgi:hypothetical protein
LSTLPKPYEFPENRAVNAVGAGRGTPLVERLAVEQAISPMTIYEIASRLARPQWKSGVIFAAVVTGISLIGASFGS